jgi:SAM-dependent methyltransferase
VAGHAGTPRLYTDLAGWFHLLTAPEDYAEEAEYYSRVIVDASRDPVRQVLELGSGGGNNASHMKRDFDLTLTDLSAEMLAISRSLNPECEHVQGDMRTLRLGRTFDAVFVHDAVAYITAEDDLRAVMETVAVHLAPGGVLLIVPDYVRETFRESTDHGGHDGEDGRAIRYLEWVWDPDPGDTTYIADYAYLLREAGGSARAVHDRHHEGLFGRETWMRLLDAAGFDATELRFMHSEVKEGLVLFLGLKRD